MATLTCVTVPAGDWEAWYLDDALIEQGHSVETRNVLEAVVTASVLIERVESREVTEDTAESGGWFPDSLTAFSKEAFA